MQNTYRHPVRFQASDIRHSVRQKMSHQSIIRFFAFFLFFLHYEENDLCYRLILATLIVLFYEVINFSLI